MITDRWLGLEDYNLLALSLAQDEHHKGTQPEFFTQLGTVCKVYEDEQGPICFVRGAKALRLDIQYVDNNDRRRNMAAMLGGFEELAASARENGFTEIIFQSNNPLLKAFCVKRLGFVESDGELRKKI